MNQEISSLMDGELEAHEAERTIRSCCATDDSKDSWYLYHVIGETLRGHAPARLERDRGVMRALSAEPTVLAPRPRAMESTVGRIALATAASMATIGIVGWIGMQGGPTAAPAVVAKGTSAASIKPVAETTLVPIAPAINVQDYLAAHRQIPSPDLYRPVANTKAAAGAR